MAGWGLRVAQSYHNKTNFLPTIVVKFSFYLYDENILMPLNNMLREIFAITLEYEVLLCN